MFWSEEAVINSLQLLSYYSLQWNYMLKKAHESEGRMVLHREVETNCLLFVY